MLELLTKQIDRADAEQQQCTNWVQRESHSTSELCGFKLASCPSHSLKGFSDKELSMLCEQNCCTETY